jgi:hypothetical protein
MMRKIYNPFYEQAAEAREMQELDLQVPAALHLAALT